MTIRKPCMTWRTTALSLSIAASLAVSWSAAVQAQLLERSTGSNIRRTNAIDPSIVRKMEKAMARCVIGLHAKDVSDLLAKSDQTNIDFASLSYDAKDINEELSLNYCLGQTYLNEEYGGVELRFNVGRFRTTLAEEAYLAKHGSALARSDHWTETISDRFIVPAANPVAARIRGSFADCVVFHAPSEADALLRTEVGSEGERAAVTPLVPALSKCLSEGEQLELTVPTVRAFAANGLWARSHYQGQSPLPSQTVAASK